MFRALQNPPNRIFESSEHSLSVRLLTNEYNCRKYEQIRTWQRLLSIRSLLAVTEHPMGTTPEELMATQNVEKVPKGSTLQFLLSTRRRNRSKKRPESGSTIGSIPFGDPFR